MSRWLSLVVLLVVTTRADAQISLRPALQRSDAGWTPALRFRALWESERCELAAKRPWETRLMAEVDAPLTWSASHNTESLRTALAYGWEKSLKKVEPQLQVEETSPIDWGFLRLQGGLELEAPQTIDVVTGALGFVVEYLHRERRIFFIPSVRVALAVVGCASCTATDGSDGWARLDGEAGVTVPLPVVELRLKTRAVRAFGAPGPDDVDFREFAFSGNVELAYRRSRGKGWWEVFARWYDGRMPVASAQGKAWTLGLTYAF